jgi:hypothetical protein
MFARFGAQLTAVDSARGRHLGFNFRILTAITAAASLAGCVPETARLAGTDPADPLAHAARTGYRSTIAPYTSQRPSAPAPWRERNDNVAPSSRPDR